jgi:hypothetical protein
MVDIRCCMLDTFTPFSATTYSSVSSNSILCYDKVL